MNVDVHAVSVRPATAADMGDIARLLGAADLPTDGVADALDGFVVASVGGRIVAVAGFETYGDSVLVRSVAVAADARGNGLGKRLVADRLARACELGATTAVLLTTTAEQFFARLGFARVSRDDVVGPVRASAEFTTLCPDTAAVMRRALEPSSPTTPGVQR